MQKHKLKKICILIFHMLHLMSETTNYIQNEKHSVLNQYILQLLKNTFLIGCHNILFFVSIQWHGAKQYFYRKYKCAAVIGVCSGPAETFHNRHLQQVKWGRESAGRVC